MFVSSYPLIPIAVHARTHIACAGAFAMLHGRAAAKGLMSDPYVAIWVGQ